LKTQKVALYYRCKTPDGWKRLPAALNKLKKVRPRYAQVGDEQILYPDGHYVLRHYVNRKAVWKDAGEDATEAQRLQQQTMSTFSATKAADEAGIAVVTEEGRVNLARKAGEYVLRQRNRGKLRHVKVLSRQLPDFLQSVGVTYADQLSEGLMLKWYGELQTESKNKSYTIHNKHVNIFGFLKWAGVETKSLAPNGPPQFVTQAVKVYTPEELDLFFSKIKKPYHRLVFEVLLKTGMREQEAAYLEWHNFDFERGTVTVLWKPEYGFQIKDRAERVIPLPDGLAESLLAWRKARPKSNFVLGNSRDKANTEWLPMLKRIVRRGGLTCGRCATCKEENKKRYTREKGGCERWTLKKFRSTYTTMMLRSGKVDPRTLMEWTGHSRLETIMLYMAPAEAKESKEKVNSVEWTRPPSNGKAA
jgi:integrase